MFWKFRASVRPYGAIGIFELRDFIMWSASKPDRDARIDFLHKVHELEVYSCQTEPTPTNPVFVVESK